MNSRSDFWTKPCAAGIWPVLALLLVAYSVNGADLCAVTIQVTTPDGRPTQARVRLFDADGRVVQTLTTDGKPVQFCDLALGPHSIVVDRQVNDGGTCFPTAISNLRLRETPIVLRGILNCAGNGAWETGCRKYFRIRSTLGEPLPLALISPEAGGHMEADSFGRAWIPLLDGHPMHLTISHAGYSPQSVEVDCAKGPNEREIHLIPSN